MRAVRLALIAFAILAPAAHAQAPDGFFTINGNALNASPVRDTHLAAIARMGVTAVRSDALWNVVEPSPGTYRWSGYDGFVGAMARHGLTWRPLLGNSPSWNRVTGGSWTARPADPASAAGVAAALLRRYGVDGAFWAENPDLTPRPVRWIEAWNEPNLTPGTAMRYPPAEYAGFLRAVAEGAHGVDPGAQVVVGGLVPLGTTSARGMTPGDFLAAVAAADPAVPAMTQGVATHVFGTDPAAAERVLRGVRDQLAGSPFANAALHLNETGSPVAPADAIGGEPARAAFLESIVGRVACDVASVAPYTWLTSESDAADPEHWYGIANVDGTLRPSAEGFARGVTAATAARARCASPAPAAAVPTAAAAAPAPVAATPPAVKRKAARSCKSRKTRKARRRCIRTKKQARSRATAQRSTDR